MNKQVFKQEPDEFRQLRSSQISRLKQSRSLSAEFIGKRSSQINYNPDDADIRNKKNSKILIIQTEISDFIVVEVNEQGQQFQILSMNDWKKIIKQHSTSGYNMIDIHVSLLTQNLDFIERRQLWLLVCGIDETLLRNRLYDAFRHQKSSYLTQIERDVRRSGAVDEHFFKEIKNQQSLQNILLAYANFDPELGYTQGMNFMVANLMMCYDIQQNDEALQDFEILDVKRDEHVFQIFCNIMVEKNWRSVFMDGFPGLIRMMIDLEKRFRHEIPDLYSHFFEQGVGDLQICFAHYYMTLLMHGVPWKFSRTILDLFLFEGEQIIHQFIIAILKYSKSILITKQFHEIIRYCKDNLLTEFYALYETQYQGEKDLTKTLTRIGLIKIMQDRQVEEPKKQEVQSPQKQQKTSLGSKLKRFFYR